MQTQEWSDHEDVPRRITKTTCSGGNSVFTYVREKEEAVFPTMPLSLLDNEEKCQDQWINRGRRRLFHVLKAVLFETSLVSFFFIPQNRKLQCHPFLVKGRLGLKSVIFNWINEFVYILILLLMLIAGQEDSSKKVGEKIWIKWKFRA